jgi:hypothetical protein
VHAISLLVVEVDVSFPIKSSGNFFLNLGKTDISLLELNFLSAFYGLVEQSPLGVARVVEFERCTRLPARQQSSE